MRLHQFACIASMVILGSWSCAAEPQGKSADGGATTAAAEDVAATISQLEREWVGAIEKKDAGTLDRLMSPDFVGTSPTAHTYTKSIAIDDLKKDVYVVDKMEMDDVSVNVYGTTAISFTSQEETSTYAGKPTSGHYHFTDVWVKRDGRWQVVASHGTRYEEAAANENKGERK
jgi:ketosteroid isomerase-like protein